MSTIIEMLKYNPVLFVADVVWTVILIAWAFMLLMWVQVLIQNLIWLNAKKRGKYPDPLPPSVFDLFGVREQNPYPYPPDVMRKLNQKDSR